MFCKVRFIILFYALKYLNEKSTTIILKTWDKKQWNQGHSFRALPTVDLPRPIVSHSQISRPGMKRRN